MPRMSKTAPVKVNATLRRREVAELRAAKMTWDEVAAKVGVSESRARQLYKEFEEQFKDENLELADAIRQEQLNEIRLLKNIWFPLANHPDATPRHLDAFIKLMAHEAAIAGAKAAVETKTTTTLQGPNGGPVQTVGASLDLTKLDTDRLAMLQAMLQDLHDAAGGTAA